MCDFIERFKFQCKFSTIVSDAFHELCDLAAWRRWQRIALDVFPIKFIKAQQQQQGQPQQTHIQLPEEVQLRLQRSSPGYLAMFGREANAEIEPDTAEALYESHQPLSLLHKWPLSEIDNCGVNDSDSAEDMEVFWLEQSGGGIFECECDDARLIRDAVTACRGLAATSNAKVMNNNRRGRGGGMMEMDLGPENSQSLSQTRRQQQQRQKEDVPELDMQQWLEDQKIPTEDAAKYVQLLLDLGMPTPNHLRDKTTEQLKQAGLRKGHARVIHEHSQV